VTQIRGAVAEYERTLIADRMRRGRLAKLRSGQLLPWTRAPYGYRLHLSGRVIQPQSRSTRSPPWWSRSCSPPTRPVG
jgi:DNA invertase Pin-like site-specific DNA recombinase